MSKSDSDLSEAPGSLAPSNPFTIASKQAKANTTTHESAITIHSSTKQPSTTRNVKSVGITDQLDKSHRSQSIAPSSYSSAPVARNTRNFSQRRGIVIQKSPKRRRGRLPKSASASRSISDQRPLASVPRIIRSHSKSSNPGDNTTKPSFLLDSDDVEIDANPEDPMYEDILNEDTPSDDDVLIEDNFSDEDTPDQKTNLLLDSSHILSHPIRAKRADIHDQVTVVERQGRKYWQCTHCSKKYNTAGGTKIMRDHLVKTHGWSPLGNSIELKRKREGESIEAAIGRMAFQEKERFEKHRLEVLIKAVDKKTLEYLYIKWMIAQDIPLVQVEKEEFRTLLEYINPGANTTLPDSARTIKMRIFALFEEGKQRIQLILRQAISSIHITCDGWTSPNNLGVLAVLAHFTDKRGVLQNLLLAMKELEGMHTGVNQGNEILGVLDSYQIRNKLGYFVLDNVNSNDTLVDTVANSLQGEGIYYNSSQHRLRCNGHIINLAVSAFLFGKHPDAASRNENWETNAGISKDELAHWRKLGPLEKLHNIVTYIMMSTQRIQAFKHLSGGLMVHRDNGTRWNSWYHMLDWSLTRIKSALQHYCNDEAALTEDILLPNDWSTLKLIRDFLKGFLEATKFSEGREATIDRVLPTMDFLLAKFENASEEYTSNEYLSVCIDAGWQKLKTYWNKADRAPVYIAAIVLNPRYKWNYFRHWEEDWIADAKSSLKLFWESTYRSSTGLTSFDTGINNDEVDKDNDFLQWMTAIDKPTGNTDELEEYINEPVLSRTLSPAALVWWRQSIQRERFPLLSAMAIDIFSILAMFSEAERVFSGARRTLTDDRGSMKIDTLEAIECLKSWFRCGLFENQDVHDILAMAQSLDTQDEVEDER